MADGWLPPVQLWAGIAVGWFSVSALGATVIRGKNSEHPGLLFAASTILILAFIGAYVAGLGIALLLLIPSGRAYWRALTGRPEAFAQARYRTYLRFVGPVAVLALMSAAVVSCHVHRNRTTGEFIVQWESAGAARGVLRHLEIREPHSLGDYRYIVENGSTLAPEAAGRLAVLGDESDLERIESAIGRADNEYNEERLRDAKASLRARLEEQP